LENLSIFSGWLFQGPQGEQCSMSSFSEEFYRILFAIRDEDPSRFEPTMDIMEDYHLARSLRRGATSTRVMNAAVSQRDIDLINRWNTEGEELINGLMRVIYSDWKQMLETFLCFLQALLSFFDTLISVLICPHWSCTNPSWRNKYHLR
jgi:hypothetical protein